MARPRKTAEAGPKMTTAEDQTAPKRRGRKPAAAKAAAPKVSGAKAARAKAAASAPVAAPEKPVVIDAEAGVELASVVVRKKDFIERVVALSGVKKGQAKEVTEAVLSALGEALSKGESLTLPPLGKLRVAKHTDTSNGAILVVKVKRGSSEDAETSPAPLAEPAE